jgi:hydrogenase expression/formation protein HypE
MSVTGREQRVLEIIETARAKRARFRDKQITLAHGAGGKATQTLIEGLLVPAFGGETLAAMGDAANVELGGARLAMTSDSFVVSPLRFPGGSIGELAVNGTANDLAMAGARPRALTVSMILEEGLDSDILRAEVQAIADAAQAAGVEIVGGDTKVVQRGLADGMYLCTTGIGAIDPRAQLSTAGIRPGDQILVSGPIGEHGTAIMLARDQFDLDAEVESDTCCLWPAVDALLDAVGGRLHCLRDATRGGVASVLNELARASSARPTCPSPRSWARPRSCWGSTPCTSPMRAASWPSWLPRRPSPRCRHCARCPAASGRRLSARCGSSHPGW